MLELCQPTVNSGVLVMTAVMYLWQTPRTIEKVTKAVEADTEVIGNSEVYHEQIEGYLDGMKRDIEGLKCNRDDRGMMEVLSRVKRKVDDLGK